MCIINFLDSLVQKLISKSLSNQVALQNLGFDSNQLTNAWKGKIITCRRENEIGNSFS